MSLVLQGVVTAIGPNLTASYLASGGTEPYTYSVVPGGAGGSIDSDGIYTSPMTIPQDPAHAYDTILVVDAAAATASRKVLVGDALLLFCEILQQELGLADGRVYLWNQKLFQPQDSSLYIAVSLRNAKPFGNTVSYDPTTGLVSKQSVNMQATLELNIISRSTEALNRKEEVLMALMSDYAQFQQAANSFSIGRLPPNGQFINLSQIDGAAIPYRFTISINIQYFVTKFKSVDYYDQIQDVPVTVES